MFKIHWGGAVCLFVVVLGLGLPYLSRALTEELLTVTSVTVGNTTEYRSALLDASSYDSLSLSFAFDATTLDFGPPQDSFVYGYKVGGIDQILGSFLGLAGATSSEVGVVSLGLPNEALVSDLQVFITVTANSTQSSDRVVVTDLKLTGVKSDPIDLCPNLDGVQSTIPSGFHLEGIDCVPDVVIVDVCSNLAGVQESLPAGYQSTTEGICTPLPPVDRCANLDGIQETVPDGYQVTEGGVCTLIPLADLCLNLPGNQSSVPEGYVQNGLNCTPLVVDICPNLSDVQITIPDGYVLVGADCVLVQNSVDRCPNLPDIQLEIPNGYEIKDGSCVVIITDPVDLCPNLPGVQELLPNGYEKLGSGECVLIPLDICLNLPEVQLTLPAGYYRNSENECMPVIIDEDKPRGGGGSGNKHKKGTRIQKYYHKNVAFCPTGYAKWIDQFRESHVWVADDVYQEVLLVGGPKPGQRNLDGAYYLKITGPTEVGDRYFRRFHKIAHVCVKG